MSALFEPLLRLGDNTLILGHRLGEWCGKAPALEEDIALANTALDFIGQTQMWLGLAAAPSGSAPWMYLTQVPVGALVDFELTLSMPRRLTADTGLDSLCHALEAYVSRKANAFTDSIALTALASISRHLRTACEDPDNREAREAMMLAATQGGIAFANASVTLIHGMSRPLGALFHVPHGLSNAMLLPEVTAWSVGHAPQRYAECARVMGLAQARDSDTQAADRLVAGLRQLTADLEVPGPRQWGIAEEPWFANLDTMAAQALASGSPGNNPRVPEATDIVALYRRVWAA